MTAVGMILALAVMVGGPSLDPRPAQNPSAAAGAPQRAPVPHRPLAGGGATTPRGKAAGIATWYRWRPGEAAAGPALRRALGSSWRGRVVTVTANGRLVTVRLTDWMRADRLIDLAASSFSQLAPLSRGIQEVTVSW